MKRLTLLVIVASSFLTPFTLSSVNIALPSIGVEFQCDAHTLNWIATSFLVTSAMSLLPLGKLADLKGRKTIFSFGLFIFTISSLLSALSNSPTELIIFRALQGFGGAMIFSTGIAILAAVFPAEERGKALGINVSSVYLGLTLGPFLGGFLTKNFGWRSVFSVNVVVGLVVLLLALKLRVEEVKTKGKLDVVGSVIYSTLILTVMLGVSEIRLLFLTLPILTLFLLWERKTSDPLLNTDLLLKNRVFSFSNLTALLVYTSTFSVPYLLSLYLQYVKGFDPQTTGLILLVQPIIQAALSPLAGWTSDRVEPRIVASCGVALISLGLFSLSGINSNYSTLSIVKDLSVLGLGFSLFSSPNVNAIMSSVKEELYGTASATLSTMRVVGQSFSMVAVMYVFSLKVGNSPITPEVYPDLMDAVRTAYLFFSLLSCLAFLLSVTRGRVR